MSTVLISVFRLQTWKYEWSTNCKAFYILLLYVNCHQMGKCQKNRLQHTFQINLISISFEPVNIKGSITIPITPSVTDKVLKFSKISMTFPTWHWFCSLLEPGQLNILLHTKFNAVPWCFGQRDSIHWSTLDPPTSSLSNSESREISLSDSSYCSNNIIIER